MNRNLLILGAGQYGQLVREVALSMGCFEKIDFLDDVSPMAIGTMGASAGFVSRYALAIPAVGSSTLRLDLIHRLTGEGFSAPVRNKM